jgi:autotransporter-associated beta strand protein
VDKGAAVATRLTAANDDRGNTCESLLFRVPQSGWYRVNAAGTLAGLSNPSAGSGLVTLFVLGHGGRETKTLASFPLNTPGGYGGHPQSFEAWDVRWLEAAQVASACCETFYGSSPKSRYQILPNRHKTHYGGFLQAESTSWFVSIGGAVMSFNFNPLSCRIAKDGILVSRGPIQARLRSWPACSLMAVLLAMFAQPAQAGTTWDGGGGANINFTTAANWNDDVLPSFTGGTSTLTFATAGSTASVTTTANVARFVFNSGSTFTLYSDGSPSTLQGESVGGVVTGITAGPANANTSVGYSILASIALGQSQSWSVANNGTGTTSLSMSGVISGAGMNLTKVGSGTLTLTGANTFSGSLSVAEGTLSFDSWNNWSTNGRLGNSSTPVVLGSAATSGTLVYTGNAILGGGTNIRGFEVAAGGGTLRLGGGVGASVNIQGSSITGSGPVTYDFDPFGTGASRRIWIVGNSTFSGPVTVATGQLQTNLQFSSGTYTPFGTGANGLGPAMTLAPNTTLTVWSNVQATDVAILIGSLAGSGTVRPDDGGRYNWIVGGNNTSTTFSGVLSQGGQAGPMRLTKIGSGTLTLSGSNTFTGTMAINEGAVSVISWNLSATNGVWGNATSFIQMNGGRINYTGASASGNLRGVNLASGTNTIDVASGATLNFSGSNTFQSNGGNLVKEGAGTLQLGSPGIANNVFTGKATINSGTLDWFGASSMPTPATLVSDFLTINNGAAFALSYNDASTTVSANIGVRLSGNATIVSGTASNAFHTIAGPIADGATSGSLMKTGPGTLTLSASNSFTGSTRSVAGTLNLNNASALLQSTLDMNAEDSGSVTFAGNTTLGGLTGSRDLNLGTRVVSIGNNGQSTTYSGALSNGSLTKVGSGALTLSGSSSYTGATSVAAGALLVNGTLGATAVTVESGGLLGGSGLIGGSVSVLAGGTFSPGNSPGLLTSGSLSLAGTTLMEIDGLAPRGGVGGYDAADVNGLLTYGGSMLIDFGSGITSALADNMTFNLFSFTSSSSSFSGISTVSDGSFYAGLTFTNSGNNDKWTATKGAQTLEFTHSTGSLVIVPEPGAIALALTGIALGAGLRWRRRRAA